MLPHELLHELIIPLAVRLVETSFNPHGLCDMSSIALGVVSP